MGDWVAGKHALVFVVFVVLRSLLLSTETGGGNIPGEGEDEIRMPGQ